MSGKTHWLTDDSEVHPESNCPSAGDWIAVATDGHNQWISCSQCNKSWTVPGLTEIIDFSPD